MTSGQRVAASQLTSENLIVVRSQHTGVDLRAGAAYSHLLEPHKNMGHSEVVQTGDNNQGQNTTGNVFNRLGK